MKLLTLAFNGVGRTVGAPSWLITVFDVSISKEGKRGVPGGVRSLKRKKMLSPNWNNNHSAQAAKDTTLSLIMKSYVWILVFDCLLIRFSLVHASYTQHLCKNLVKVGDFRKRCIIRMRSITKMTIGIII